MTFSPEQIKLLQEPLDPKHVKKPSGSFGPKGDYIEGWHCINEMNRVFGFDGWSYTIELTRDALEKDDAKNQWQAAYTCICTLTVAGVTRQDVGFGSGFAKGVGDAIEGATKEAVTDALKRAARTFGNIFGLALYDKSRVNVQSAPEPVQMINPDDIDVITALSIGSGVSIQTIVEGYQVSALTELTPLQAKKTINNLKRRIAENQKEAA